MTEITQADREAAAVFYGTWGGTRGWPHLEEPIREGLVDDNALVRAFACHRMKANETQAREIERLREALREVFEEWAGSEGFIPETAPEGYLLHLTKRMADIARAALGDTK